jgi:hypothetical protein
MIELFSNGGANDVSPVFRVQNASNGNGGTGCIYVRGLATGSVELYGTIIRDNETIADAPLVIIGTILSDGMEIMSTKPTHIRAILSADAPANGVIVRVTG